MLGEVEMEGRWGGGVGRNKLKLPHGSVLLLYIKMRNRDTRVAIPQLDAYRLFTRYRVT